MQYSHNKPPLFQPSPEMQPSSRFGEPTGRSGSISKKSSPRKVVGISRIHSPHQSHSFANSPKGGIPTAAAPAGRIARQRAPSISNASISNTPSQNVTRRSSVGGTSYDRDRDRSSSFSIPGLNASEVSGKSTHEQTEDSNFVTPTRHFAYKRHPNVPAPTYNTRYQVNN
jgi:hypothetical protein